jgi:hypothetical protein
MTRQYDLFETKIQCFFIRNVDDNNLEKLSTVLHTQGNVFVLESGDYAKSKKATDHCIKDDAICAIASFHNNITLHSICGMLMPDVSKNIHNIIVEIINNSNEALLSFFAKISLLLDDIKNASVKENSIDYCTELKSGTKQTFLQGLDIIPTIKYLLNAAVRETFFSKPQPYIRLNIRKRDVFETLLKAEIKQKLNGNVSKSHIYRELLY